MNSNCAIKDKWIQEVKAFLFDLSFHLCLAHQKEVHLLINSAGDYNPAYESKVSPLIFSNQNRNIFECFFIFNETLEYLGIFNNISLKDSHRIANDYYINS